MMQEKPDKKNRFLGPSLKLGVGFLFLASLLVIYNKDAIISPTSFFPTEIALDRVYTSVETIIVDWITSLLENGLFI